MFLRILLPCPLGISLLQGVEDRACLGRTSGHPRSRCSSSCTGLSYVWLWTDVSHWQHLSKFVNGDPGSITFRLLLRLALPSSRFVPFHPCHHPHTTPFLLIAVPCLFYLHGHLRHHHLKQSYSQCCTRPVFLCSYHEKQQILLHGPLRPVRGHFRRPPLHLERPTILEKHLWRPSSSTITVISPTVAPINYVLEMFEPIKGFEQVLLVSDCILLFVYVPRRLCLVAEAHCRLLSWLSSGQTTFLTYSGFRCILISSIMCQLSCRCSLCLYLACRRFSHWGFQYSIAV